jgi:hypothetical protein
LAAATSTKLPPFVLKPLGRENIGFIWPGMGYIEIV